VKLKANFEIKNHLNEHKVLFFISHLNEYRLFSTFFKKEKVQIKVLGGLAALFPSSGRSSKYLGFHKYVADCFPEANPKKCSASFELQIEGFKISTGPFQWITRKSH